MEIETGMSDRKVDIIAFIAAQALLLLIIIQTVVLVITISRYCMGIIYLTTFTGRKD